MGLFTNVQYNYKEGRLRFRCPKKSGKSVLTPNLFNQARREHPEPTLSHVAQLADLDKNAIEKLNWKANFASLDQIVKTNEKDPQYGEPWYLLYRLFALMKPHKPTPNVKLNDLLLLIQAQRSAPKHELIAEHQLCNMAASDYGSHSAIPHQQAASFIKLLYRALLVSRHIYVSRMHLAGVRRVQPMHVNQMKQWVAGTQEKLFTCALNQIEKLVSKDQLRSFQQFM